MIRAAAVQLSAGPDKKKNLVRALRLIARAARGGADLVALPENFLFRGTDRQFKSIPETLSGPSLSALAREAARLRIHLLAGSIAEAVPGSRKTYNTSCLIAPTGKVQSVYRKIHLFDVDLPRTARGRTGRGQRIRESDRCLRGKKPMMGVISAGVSGAAARSARRSNAAPVRCGLSICYDLRFPELYRTYALLGARILFVPSNFTRRTGQDHWEPLLRARAIENQCFVVAPGQSGVGSQGVLSHGRTLIIDPWGRILARGPGSGEAILYADLDFECLERVRRTIPSLSEAARG